MQKMINRIYTLDTRIFDQKDEFDKWYNMMPKERQIKISNYVFLKDKKLSLGAGVLLYSGLKNLNILDEIICFNENGKPYIQNYENVYFNISHSNKYVVCAFSDKEIGIDIEENFLFDERLIENVYNLEEIEYIKQSKKDKLYTKLWTTKESLMKYLGTGITLNPKNISIDLESNKCIKCDLLNSKEIYFKNYNIENYSLTVCSEYKDFNCSLEWFGN